MDIFDLSQVSVHDMLLVQAIAKHGSISKAASETRVAQPTASYRLNKLRGIFNDPIFVSVNRQMHPSAKGKRIISAFGGQLGNLGALIEPDNFDPMLTTRTFRVVAQGFQLSALLAKVPQAFFGATKQAKLFIEGANSEIPINQQLNETVDFFAWPFDKKGGKGIRRMVSPALNVVVYFDKATRDAPATIEEFANCRFVVLDSLKISPSFIDDELVRRGFKQRNVVSYASSSETIARLVKGTDLVFIGTVFTIAHGMEGLTYTDIPMDVPDIRHEIRWSIARESDPAHAWFRDIILKSSKAAMKPSYCIDPSEGYVQLSEFDRLKEGIPI